jgi:hypothetical protein
MEGQLQIIPCAWCGEGSEGKIQIHEPRQGKDREGRPWRTEAVLAPICAACLARIVCEKPLKRSRRKLQEERLF